VLLSKYYEVDKIKENEMGEAFCMHRRKGRHGRFWYGNLKKRDRPLWRPSDRWRIILQYVLTE
jgi:hypothetical protein